MAERLGVTYQAVRKWEKGRVPAERCHQFVRATDLTITVHDLRPDIFGPAPGVAPESCTRAASERRPGADRREAA